MCSFCKSNVAIPTQFFAHAQTFDHDVGPPLPPPPQKKITPCKGIHDILGFWILRRALWIPDSLSVELGFWIAIVSGTPASLSWIPDSRTSRFRIPRAKIYPIPKFGFPCMGPFVSLFSYFHKDTLDVSLRTALSKTSMGKDKGYPSWTKKIYNFYP